MRKAEFNSELRRKLSNISEQDTQKHIEYYNEIIDDRMEEGLNEEEAVEALGPIDKIVSDILEDTPLPKLIKEKVAKRRTLRTWEVILLILGSPIWASLLLAAVIVIFSLYIVLWSIVVVLYSLMLSFAAVALSGILSFIVFAAHGNILSGIFYIGAGTVCAGLSILTLFLSNLMVKGVVAISKKIPMAVKHSIAGRN